MIYSDSRYSNGNIFKAYKPSTDSFEVTVTRNFPSATSEFFVYVWTQNDRIEEVARKYYGSGKMWWRIMDFNPQISNPLTITPGTQIRIPSAR